MVNFKVVEDMKDFDRVFNAYMAYQRKAPGDIANTKCYYIARNCTLLTKSTKKSKIVSELKGKARDYDAPLAAIIVNKQLGAKNEDGLNGAAMAEAVEKLISKRVRSMNFLRSGWLPAIKILFVYIRKSGESIFAKRWEPPVNKSVKQFGKDKGTAIYAKTDRPRVFAQIENNIHGNDESGNVNNIKMTGLDAGIKKEMRSMLIYLERKFNPVHRTLNRTQGT